MAKAEWEKPWCPRCRYTVERLRKGRKVCPPCADEKDLNALGFGVFILGNSGRIIP